MFMRLQKRTSAISAFVKNLGTLVITGFLLLITFYLTYKSFLGTAHMSVAGEMLEQLVFIKDSLFFNIAVTLGA